MKRILFFVSQGENDCLMAHGLDWAVYTEASGWDELAENLRNMIREDFQESERPEFIDFIFADGTSACLCA